MPLQSLLIALLSIGTTITSQANAATLPLGPELIQWQFISSATNGAYAVDEAAPIYLQIPSHAQCCSGVLQGTILNTSFENLSNTNGIGFPALLFPGIAGLQSISINGMDVFNTVRNYASVGPVIPVPEAALKSEKTEIRIKINTDFSFYSYLQPTLGIPRTLLGNFDDLLIRREKAVVFQVYAPLAIAVVFAFSALAVGWVYLQTRNSDRHLAVMLQCLLVWAIFTYSLSGELRVRWPTIGSYLHLTLRGFAAISLDRIYLSFWRNQRTARAITATLLATETIAALLTIISREQARQLVSYFVNYAAFIGILYGSKKWGEKSSFTRFILIYGVIYGVFYTNDLIKLFSQQTLLFTYPFPYLNRYFSAPIIAIPLIYLSTEATRKVVAEVREKTLREIIQQILHDIRSPITSINAILSPKTNPDLESEVIIEATNRIKAIAKSLERVATANQPVTLYESLSQKVYALINSKQIEHPTIHFIIEILSLDSNAVRLDAPTAIEVVRCISNLINNSVEASVSTSSKKVKISAHLDGGNLLLTVRDYGSGFPEEVLRKPGKRGLTTKKTGQGLGLYHAKQTAMALGGRLEVINLDEGSAVTLVLPTASFSLGYRTDS